MFVIQKFNISLEIYVNYNEYINEGEDETISVLKHIITNGELKQFKGVIDLIAVKGLSRKDVDEIKEIHDVLRNGNLEDLNVISDNKKVLDCIKSIMPDVSTVFLEVE